VLSIGIVSLSLLIISLLYTNDRYVFGQYPVIDGISCDNREHFTFHYHAHLDIFVNGISYAIPADIGIKPQDCIYWIHTHDISGIIHIESPDNRTFSLGQFFDIWGKEFNNNQIFDFVVDNSQNKLIHVYINGTNVNDLQYRDISLHDRQYITIVYGMQLSEIPTFEFPY